MSIFLVLLLLSWLDPPTGSSRMARMSSSLATAMARNSSETQAPLASLFFLGLPLLRGIFYWGGKTSTIFPPCTSLSISGSMRFDLIASVGKGIILSMPLGMLAMGEKNSQSFWGLDLEILRLCTPLFILWEVSMS
jgi:hypothetical protein